MRWSAVKFSFFFHSFSHLLDSSWEANFDGDWVIQKLIDIFLTNNFIKIVFYPFLFNQGGIYILLLIWCFGCVPAIIFHKLMQYTFSGAHRAHRATRLTTCVSRTVVWEEWLLLLSKGNHVVNCAHHQIFSKNMFQFLNISFVEYFWYVVEWNCLLIKILWCTVILCMYFCYSTFACLDIHSFC